MTDTSNTNSNQGMRDDDENSVKFTPDEEFARNSDQNGGNIGSDTGDNDGQMARDLDEQEER